MENKNHKINECLETLKKDKKLLIVIAVGIAGMLLLLLSSTDCSRKTAESDTVSPTAVTISVDNAEKALEDRLKNVLKNVNGAGSITAMVTLKSTGEIIYAKNIKNDTESQPDKSSNRYEGEYIIYEPSDGDSSGLVVSIKGPEVSGVAVLCDGGDSALIKTEITKIVTNLFGIGANRVYVGKKT